MPDATPNDPAAAPHAASVDVEDAAVLYERRGYVGVLTLNRPTNRNSMTADILGAYATRTAEIAADPDVRCVVITGRGSCFSAGADLKAQIQVEGEGRARLAHEKSFGMYTAFLSTLSVEVPVIAAMNGHAVGGGFGLSLLADIRVANSGSKYGANFTRLGLHPGLGISYLLPRLIGASRAAELLFTGRLVRGDEAARLGIASYAEPDADAVMARAMGLAEEIAASAPLAVRMTKRTFWAGLGWDVPQAAFTEAFAQAATVETADFKEGMAALLGKRTPQFTGS